MKFSVFGFASLALFAVSSVIASPVAVEPKQLAQRTPDDIDVIVNNLYSSVQTTNLHYQTVCASSCSSSHITAYCGEIATLCYTAIDQCNLLPSGHKFLDKNLIAGIVCNILVAVQNTLKFLLTKCGLLGILTGILALVGGLITALNALLACLAIYVDGLLGLVSGLLFGVVGLLGCLLCSLGLIL